MTDDDRKRISELRLEGKGYKAIASILGLSRDSVRGYCRRNELDGDGIVAALNIQEKVNRNILCAQCKQPLKQVTRGRAKRFCSDACRTKWWNEHQEKRNKSETAIYHYTCAYCGKEFSAYGNKNRKYCSHNCYIRDRFWREEDGIQEVKN